MLDLFIKNKWDPCFKESETAVEGWSCRKVRVLRTDRGGEYISGDFSKYYKSYGMIVDDCRIRQEFSHRSKCLDV